MSKLYDEKIVSDLQKAINNGNFQKRSVKNFDEISHIYVGGIDMKLCMNNGIKSVLIKPDDGIDKVYMSKWKNYAPGKFLSRDWKRDNRDFIGCTYYYIIDYNVVDTLGESHQMKALVRNLYELHKGELKDTELNDLVAEYGDIKLVEEEGSIFFSIIKIWNENDSLGLCSRNMFGNVEYHKDDSFSSIIEEALDEDPTTPVQEEPNTTPLF